PTAPEASIGGAGQSEAAPVFSADIQNIVDAFMQSELSHSAMHFLGTGGPITEPELIETLVGEFSDDVAALRQLLAQLGGGKAPLPILTEMNERAHKIKGSAHTAGAHVIGAVGEMMEELLQLVRQNRIPVNDTIARWFISALDALESLLTLLATTQTDEGDNDLLATLHEGYAIILATISNVSPNDTLSMPVLEDMRAVPTAPSHSLSTLGSARVDVRRLDRLLEALSTLFINHIETGRLHEEAITGEREIERAIARLTQLYDRLRRERIQLLENTAHAASAPSDAAPLPATARWGISQPGNATRASGDAPPDMEHYSEFDLIMAMLGETLSDLRAMDLQLQTALHHTQRQNEYDEYLTDTLQRDLLALRLVPLREVEYRLQLTLRAVAAEEHKTVELTLDMGEVEIDSDIVTVLAEPLTQLVRNAVVHGIESAEERRDAGKDPLGHIHLRAAYAGEGVTIAISDDGRGISPQRIAGSAMVVKGPNGLPLLTEEQARGISREDAFALMFLPDVSTAIEVRPAAGRGMGLPTVRRAVAGVRGTITIDSEPGQGTTFTLHLPTTLSTIRCVVVGADANRYAIPLSDIVRTTRVAADAFFVGEDGRAHAHLLDLLGGEATLPVVTLADLLDHREIPMRGGHALIVAVAGQEYAVLVDDLGDQREMMVRRVPRHLSRQGVRGAAIDPDGAVLLILDLPRVVTEALASGRFGAQKPVLAGAVPLPAQGDYILLVDDSPSMRQGLRQMLQAAGFSVQTARDGLDAIQQITQQLPRLMVLDVEMPQMNGYDVLEVLRAHPPFKGVRAIMLTSRSAAKYRDYALRLGALDYLVKPVTGERLVAAITHAVALTTNGTHPQ
nr:response regulator [Ktedonobacterales bacterium]